MPTAVIAAASKVGLGLATTLRTRRPLNQTARRPAPSVTHRSAVAGATEASRQINAMRTGKNGGRFDSVRAPVRPAASSRATQA